MKKFIFLLFIPCFGFAQNNTLAAIFSQANCETISSAAGVEGFKQWCWSDLESEISNTTALASFSGGDLNKSVHYNTDGTYVENGRLNFNLNPTTPAPSGQTHNYNYRQEIRDNPSSVDHVIGTEQWWGFDYKFENGYIADTANESIIWQIHGSFSTPSNPMVSLWLGREGMQSATSNGGELYIVNSAFNTASPKYTRTGIFPVAGQTLNIVIQLVWGDATTGVYKVWIDDVLIYDNVERTVYVEEPEGGYWKVGIYKWRWQTLANVNSSSAIGVDEMHTSIGTMRVVTKLNTNPTYLKDEYNTVKPN